MLVGILLLKCGLIVEILGRHYSLSLFPWNFAIVDLNSLQTFLLSQITFGKQIRPQGRIFLFLRSILV